MPDQIAPEYKEADRRRNGHCARLRPHERVQYSPGRDFRQFQLAGSDNRFRNCVPDLLSLAAVLINRVGQWAQNLRLS